MNSKNLWIACLSGAVVTTLVSNLPLVGFVNCMLCAGFWGSAIFAVWLYRRLSGTLTVNQGVTVGFLTGLCAGLLGFLLGFLGLTGAAGFVNSFKSILPPGSTSGMNFSLPAWGSIIFNLIGVMFNLLFGTVGGWIGGSIFRSDRNTGKG